MRANGYPSLILGCDNFLRPLFLDRFRNENAREHIISTMQAAFMAGAHGVDVNVTSADVYHAFWDVKNCYPEIVGIGDPNMNCGFMLDGLPLKNSRGRVLKTIYEVSLSKAEHDAVRRMDANYREYFFPFSRNDKVLSEGEIAKIYLDEDIWCGRLKKLSACCDFCLFGADYADWLIALGRTDLLEYQANMIIAHHMVPISVCHWASKTLPILDRMRQIVGHWVYANPEQLLLMNSEATEAVRRAGHVTGFRVLRGIHSYFTMKEALSWIVGLLGIESFVIGASDHVCETERLFRAACEVLSGYTDSHEI